MKRKICFITGSRAEYGILKPLINEACTDLNLSVQLVATGTHLSPEFGLTYKEIEEDGFNIDEKVEALLSSDTPVGVSKSMGLTIISFAEVYNRLDPDIAVVLGDRFEIFSAVAAALICKIPVAHIGGGEVTEGAFDDSLRHSITKMSHLHFTSTEEYRDRVIQLGEKPEAVFNFGEIALDSLDNKYIDRTELEQTLKFKFNKKNVLVTYHPVTLGGCSSRVQFEQILTVLNELEDTQIIFTKSNADTDGRIINKMIDEYVALNSNKSIAFSSLGRFRYLSVLQHVDAVLGNSSSGIVEAPFFKVATINIGDRQKGRIKSGSIIDCDSQEESIRKALMKSFSEEFRKIIKEIVSPYYKKDSVYNIKETLKYCDLSRLLNKSFYDLNSNRHSKTC